MSSLAARLAENGAREREEGKFSWWRRREKRVSRESRNHEIPPSTRRDLLLISAIASEARNYAASRNSSSRSGELGDASAISREVRDT